MIHRPVTQVLNAILRCEEKRGSPLQTPCSPEYYIPGIHRKACSGIFNSRLLNEHVRMAITPENIYDSRALGEGGNLCK